MGAKYPILTPREIIKSLERMGFTRTSQKGSHVKYTKIGIPTKVVIIPMHDEIARGTLKSILIQGGISLEEFLQNL